jgi:hypothetical protein
MRNVQFVCSVVITLRNLLATDSQEEKEMNIVPGPNAVDAVAIRACSVTRMLVQHDDSAFDRLFRECVDYTSVDCG